MTEDTPRLFAFLAGGPAPAELHPSTAPAVIRAAQRREVRAYLAEHPGATVEDIGAALDLPVWSVECRLAELRDEPVPYRAKGRPVTRSPQKVAIWRRVCGDRTFTEDECDE